MLTNFTCVIMQTPPRGSLRSSTLRATPMICKADLVTAIVFIHMRVTFDRYIVDSLMPDLVGHDKQPSAFIVFLYLWSRASPRRTGTPRGRRLVASLQQIA